MTKEELEKQGKGCWICGGQGGDMENGIVCDTCEGEGQLYTISSVNSYASQEKEKEAVEAIAWIINYSNDGWDINELSCKQLYELYLKEKTK